MFRSLKAPATALALILGASPAFAEDLGVGRAATPAEVAAWDIDVRPDFLGLPEGSGDVDTGLELWEAKCASCHGVFGESNETFTPIVGGTDMADIESGRVANLANPAWPQRTTLMKTPTVSTLFDYVKRAMPWNQPKSLTDDEVYALLAYMLNLGEIVDYDFVLSHENIAEVQARMPNRDGMMTDHAMWPGRGFDNKDTAPDVRAERCMTDCVADVTITSSLPEFARDAHGNIADQNRIFGPVVGAVTAEVVEDETAPAHPGMTMADNLGCMGCHGMAEEIVGPSYLQVAERYGDSDRDMLIAKLQQGGDGNWGDIPMPPHDGLTNDDAGVIIDWILSGAGQP